jgi:glycine C-acetyltransferase
MYNQLQPFLAKEIEGIKEAGLYKKERIITSAQAAEITIQGGQQVLNFCANNYLGLSSHPKVIEAAKAAIDTHGFGLSSVRFICGTQDIHKTLEEKISDSLNHASIIDGVRLTKSMRYRYEHNSMEDLEAKLKEAIAAGAVQKIIVTDGAFSMDGTIAQLDKIVELAEKYEALVMTDECHSTGFLGKTGKALGGASGGFTSGKKEIIDLLRQRSRPYLFSNTLAPSITGASIAVFDLLSQTTELRDTLEANTTYFREKITAAGFDIKPGTHPIIPIMLYDAVVSQKMAEKLLEKGIYVIGFYYPVVAKGQARIRVQISAAHTRAHLDQAIQAFIEVGKELGVIK